MEFITQWGSTGVISGTGIGVGQGKQSTQVIATWFQQNGESGTAAQTCQQLIQGGVTDWFLPSQAELNLMYLNLKKKGLGSFSNGFYWSSSEYDYNHAWRQQFSDGSQDTNYKESAYSVRAARAF